MSTKIRLEFAQDIDVELAKANYWLPIIRVLANIRLILIDGSLSRVYKAIVDTGSPITTVPISIWQHARTIGLVKEKFRLQGLGKGEIGGQISQIQIAFVDQRRTSRYLEIPAFLASDDQTPLIVGFHKVFSEHKLMCDYKKYNGFIQIR